MNWWNLCVHIVSSIKWLGIISLNLIATYVEEK